MPTLDFKGKSFVYAHHLGVPFRELVLDKDKSLPAKGAKATLDDNLIIHGDNLLALKALLPRYAGKVDCIFIDPPYNTGNEGWCYNDNVRSPLMKAWLAKSANPVDKEDLERHDKWLAMMWPRLQLLRELLAEHGSIWITLDDVESHRAKILLDEIFGESNFLGNVVWEKADSPRMDADYFSTRHDHLLVYAKSAPEVRFLRLPYDGEELPDHYDQKDEKGRPYYLKPLRAMGGQGETREARPNLYYGIDAPDGTKVFPKLKNGEDGAWRWSPKKLKLEKHRLEWKNAKAGWTPYFRIYADGSDGRPPETIFYNRDVGSNRTSKAQIKEILSDAGDFQTPKPTGLLAHILDIVCDKQSLVLDSFAGSGTTAHAVLAQNKKDGGNRRFILIECEDYADKLTAERVRRVIRGYPFKGTQRTELFREAVTWSRLKKAEELVQKAESIKQLEGAEYDNVTIKVEDGELVVTGEKEVRDQADGLGGSFAYATLGPEMSLDALLKDGLPTFAALARYVFYTATGKTLEEAPKGKAAALGWVGETDLYRVHLHYQADKAWLSSNEAALTESMAIALAKANTGKKRLLVFAPGKFISQRDLNSLGIEYCQIPYAIHRLMGD